MHFLNQDFLQVNLGFHHHLLEKVLVKIIIILEKEKEKEEKEKKEKRKKRNQVS